MKAKASERQTQHRQCLLRIEEEDAAEADRFEEGGEA